MYFSPDLTKDLKLNSNGEFYIRYEKGNAFGEKGLP